MIMKAAEYGRYSTDKQTENSIAYQFNKIREYCKKNDIDNVTSYSDEAQSGTNTDRKGFIDMVPVVGVEPTRCCHHRILSPARLPIPSHRRNDGHYIIIRGKNQERAANFEDLPDRNRLRGCVAFPAS